MDGRGAPKPTPYSSLRAKLGSERLEGSTPVLGPAALSMGTAGEQRGSSAGSASLKMNVLVSLPCILSLTHQPETAEKIVLRFEPKTLCFKNE